MSFKEPPVSPPAHDLFDFLLDDDLIDTAIVDTVVAMLEGRKPANDNEPKNTC